jgi:hypothetical protein
MRRRTTAEKRKLMASTEQPRIDYPAAGELFRYAARLCVDFAVRRESKNE